jgi:hypothetical protein
MPDAREYKMDVWQGQDLKFLARVVNDSGVDLTTDDISSWGLRVFDTHDRRNRRKLVSDALPQTYVFDTLQTDEGWTRDSEGWNFKYRLEYDNFRSEGEHHYTFEFVFETDDYGSIPVVYKVHVKGLGSF